MLCCYIMLYYLCYSIIFYVSGNNIYWEVQAPYFCFPWNITLTFHDNSVEYSCYAHFMEEEIEAGEVECVAQQNTASKWQGFYSDWGSLSWKDPLIPLFVLLFSGLWVRSRVSQEVEDIVGGTFIPQSRQLPCHDSVTRFNFLIS